MVRAVILLILIAVAWYLWRSIASALRRWKEGDEPTTIPATAPQTQLDVDAISWQVTSHMREREALIQVEHPIEGSWHTWRVNVYAPGASERVDAAMDAAHKLAQHLNGGSAGTAQLSS